MTSARTVSRLSRILALIPYVLERESADVADIVERFGYSPDQLSRDLNTVFVCGLPGYGPGDLMEAYIDEDEVIIDAAHYFTRAPRLTPQEALGLLAAGLTVLGMGESNPALESAVAKLAQAVVPQADAALAVDLLETPLVPELRQAAAARRVVRVTYRSVGREDTTVREVEPHIVFATLGNWYVRGYCRRAEAERTFRIDRIRDLEVLEEEFEPPRQLPAASVGYQATDDDISCIIELGPRARWVMEYYPVEVQEDDGEAARVRFSAPDAEVPARLMLRLGATARLIEGPEVAARMAELGRGILGLYS